MKYFKTYESYVRGVRGVGSLKNSLAALKRQNIRGRYTDAETLAKGIRNEYEAITGEKYEDEVQMSMDDAIADIVSHFKLDGPEFMAAWDRVVKESEDTLNEAIEWQGILLKDAMLKYNTMSGGGAPRSLQFAGQSYAKVPKGTFLIGLPGGLFAVNTKKKFAFQLTSGNRTWLDAQDKLKDGDVGGTNMAPEFNKWKQYLNESVDEAYSGNFSDFKYELDLAIDNLGISNKAIKAVKKKGKGYEVRMSSYMSDKNTWEKIGKDLGAELISFKPGSINVGIYEGYISEKRINLKQAADYEKKLKKKVPSTTKAKAANHKGEVKLFVNYKRFADRAKLKAAGEDLGLTYVSDGRVTNRPGLDFKRGDKMVGGGGVLGITDNWMTFIKEQSEVIVEKKPKGAPDFHHSDAPDAEGRFRDLSPKDLAAWLIKTRKKDLKKISGSLTQQVVFNRNDDPAYAEKMEKTRKEVYKQLGREDLLNKKD